MLSPSGTSITPTDFSVTLVSLNPSLVAGVYPSVQTQGTYGGSVSVDALGVVSLGAPAPAGNHEIIIRATDNCGAHNNAVLDVEVLTDAIFLNGFEN